MRTLNPAAFRPLRLTSRKHAARPSYPLVVVQSGRNFGADASNFSESLDGQGEDESWGLAAPKSKSRESSEVREPADIPLETYTRPRRSIARDGEKRDFPPRDRDRDRPSRPASSAREQRGDQYGDREERRGDRPPRSEFRERDAAPRGEFREFRRTRNFDEGERPQSPPRGDVSDRSSYDNSDHEERRERPRYPSRGQYSDRSGGDDRGERRERPRYPSRGEFSDRRESSRPSFSSFPDEDRPRAPRGAEFAGWEREGYTTTGPSTPSGYGQRGSAFGRSGRPSKSGQRAPAEIPEDMIDRLVDRKKKSTAGLCYGCGFQLQTHAAGSAGFVEAEKLALKASRRQTDQILCERCQALTHGAMIPGVDDAAVRTRQAKSDAAATAVTAAADALAGPAAVVSTIAPARLLVSPEQLRSDLQVIAGKRAIVLLLVDLLDASGSFFNHVRELVGKNPVVLVGTKLDVLPKGTESEDVRDWLAKSAEFKRLNVIGTFVTSSRSGEGVEETVSAVMRERKGRDVFVLGAANVGKTAFLRAIVKEMSKFSSRNFNPMAIAAAKYAPVESPMPGTTLSFIPLKAFDSDSALFDTPGLHLSHRLPHMLTPEENRALVPSKKLAAYVPPTPFVVAREAGREEVAASYYWGGLVRVDVLTGPPQTSLAFYGVSSMKVRAVPLQGPEEPVTEEADAAAAAAAAAAIPEGEMEAPFGTEAALARGGLRVAKEVKLTAPGHRGPVLDLAVSGVPGWITVFAPGRGDDVSLRVWSVRGVEVYQRPPMPVPNPTVAVV